MSTPTKPVIKFLDSLTAPTVFYTPEAWNDIQYLVQTMKTEIGWWHIIEEMSDGNYLLTHTIVPEQWVSGGETDITKDTLAEAADELIAAGVDTSKLNGWGHSHVNMGTTPSHTDVQTALSYREDIPFLIRGIYNKRNENRVDVLDFRRGLIFENVANRIMIAGITDERKAELDLIMKERVHERTYQNNSAYGRGPNQQSFGFNDRRYPPAKTPAIPPAQQQGWWNDINYNGIEYYD